jgi:hypothetical protein
VYPLDNAGLISLMGHSRRFEAISTESALHLIATKSRTSRYFGFGPTRDVRRGAAQISGARMAFRASIHGRTLKAPTTT